MAASCSLTRLDQLDKPNINNSHIGYLVQQRKRWTLLSCQDITQHFITNSWGELFFACNLDVSQRHLVVIIWYKLSRPCSWILLCFDSHNYPSYQLFSHSLLFWDSSLWQPSCFWKNAKLVGYGNNRPWRD